jgi:cellobiose PTS system EIIC component
MTKATGFVNRWLVPFLTALSENVYMAAIRTGMVTVVPLTIIGGMFMVFSYLPVPGWEARIEKHLPLLQVPVTATFGMLAVFVCFAIAYDLGKRFAQEAITSGVLATVVFLLIQVDVKEQTLTMAGLGSQGLFTAILVALVSVRVQKLMMDHGAVIRMPESVPAAVQESFLSLTPMIALVLWVIRFVWGVDINAAVQTLFKPLVFALNTLPGILTYAFLVTMLWSVGINGDNTMDAIVLPVFMSYLASNVAAVQAGQPMEFVTANGFFTTFANVGGTGATIALALVLINSRDAGYRKVARLSLPTQVFQINEPIFYGMPIVLNPLFMVPYVISALVLTGASYLLIDWGILRKPFVNVPWTTPPVIGHYLVTGGDWKAAVWGVCSILIAMGIYWPFAKAAERQRLAQVEAGKPAE